MLLKTKFFFMMALCVNSIIAMEKDPFDFSKYYPCPIFGESKIMEEDFNKQMRGFYADRLAELILARIKNLEEKREDKPLQSLKSNNDKQH